MTMEEQIEAFAGELQALCNRYCDEFDLPVGCVIGVLELQKLAIAHNALNDDAE